MLKDLVLKTRSYRRFDASVKIEEQTLFDLVDLARNTSSGANLQPLKYCISSSQEKNDLIFPCLRWAGYLPEWNGPKNSEHPTAYIVVLGDTTIVRNFGVNPGIASQTIMLGASELGLGGCMFGSINRKNLRAKLDIPEELEILYVLALGKPVEKIILEPIKEDGSIRYYRDENNTHHVPKRNLEDIIVC